MSIHSAGKNPDPHFRSYAIDQGEGLYSESGNVSAWNDLQLDRGLPACTLAVFGADGDLMRRKLMPALYRLAYDRRLSPNFAVLGIARTPFSDDQFRSIMLDAVKTFSEDTRFDEYVWRTFANNLFYLPGEMRDVQLFRRLECRLAEIKTECRTGDNVVFYLAVPPSSYVLAARGLSAIRFARESGWRRLVVEKPFGRDVSSASELSQQLHEVFDESEIYRVDHYLGKESLQNILAFRFGNSIFDSLWNRRYVNHVQITAAESVGLEGRAAYYKETGALADMVQNHLLQILATIAMEFPGSSFEAKSLHDEKSRLLRSIKIMKTEDVCWQAVAGQYGPGRVRGEDVLGFRREPDISEGEQTETFVALTLFIENRRWAGVPFYLRTGKRMPKRATEVAIQFNHAPLIADGVDAPNRLIFRIQPQEGISLEFLSKRPGPGMALHPVSMDFHHGSTRAERSPLAYENVLLDAMAGDGAFNTREDMVEAAWRVIEPIQQVWRETRFDFPNYAAGTWGPVAADEMLARRGHSWRN